MQLAYFFAFSVLILWEIVWNDGKRRAECIRPLSVAEGAIKLVKNLYKQTPKGRQKFVNDRRSDSIRT